MIFHNTRLFLVATAAISSFGISSQSSAQEKVVPALGDAHGHDPNAMKAEQKITDSLGKLSAEDLSLPQHSVSVQSWNTVDSVRWELRLS